MPPKARAAQKPVTRSRGGRQPLAGRTPRPYQGRASVLTSRGAAFFSATSTLLSWTLLDQLGVLWLLPPLRTRPWIVFPITALGALLGTTRAARFLHGAAAGVVVLWLVVLLSPLARAMAQPLRVESQPAQADAVVVLSSYVQPDGDLSEIGLTRLLRGLELVAGGYAPLLIVTEIPGRVGTHARTARDQAGRLGVRCAVESAGAVLNTRDEALRVAALARERGWRRILLVTSPTHSRRALLTFRRAARPATRLRASVLEILSTPCRETGFDLERLDEPGDRRRAFFRAINEIVGLWVYRFRGWA